MKPSRRTFCRIDDCEKPELARGLCVMHYQRWKSWGDPYYVSRTHRRGEPWVDKNGYLMVPGVTVSGRRRLRYQHTIVMEAHLGRPLAPHESVHHRNGDRTDNRIENLELWSRYQPPGQRVEDKIAWAKEFLAEYGYEVVDRRARTA